MLRNQAGDTFLNRMLLIIYGREETGMKPIDRGSYKGKKRGLKGVETYLPGHNFLTPM